MELSGLINARNARAAFLTMTTGLKMELKKVRLKGKLIFTIFLAYIFLQMPIAYANCEIISSLPANDGGAPFTSEICDFSFEEHDNSEAAEATCKMLAEGYVRYRGPIYSLEECKCFNTDLSWWTNGGCSNASNLRHSRMIQVQYRTCQFPHTIENPEDCNIHPPYTEPPIIPGLPDKPPKTPTSCGGVGNPCQVSTGAKTQAETDFSSGLGFTRFYQTLSLVDVGFGKGWRSSVQPTLSILGDNLYVVEQSGRGDPWRKVNGVWESDVDSDYLLAETANEFTVTRKRGDVMAYSLDGRLLSETDTKGNTKLYAYDSDNRLITVTNHYGVSISFAYSNDGKNHITSVTNSGNESYRYEYDANDNLIAVIYPDTTADPSDNPRKIYHYEDTDFPNHLTGITDTKGNRYGTYAYDDDGKAISTEHATTTNDVGQERFQLNYGTQGGQ